MRKIMKERMSKKDLNELIKEADADNDGFINCRGKEGNHIKMITLIGWLHGHNFLEFCSILCAEVTYKGKKKSTDNANRIKEESEKNDSSRSDSIKTLSKG